MQIPNPAVLTILVLGSSFGVTSPTPAQTDPCTQNNFQTYQCGSKCRWTATDGQGCCYSGDWYCPHGKCYTDSAYLYCCQQWQSGSGGECSPSGDAFPPFNPSE
jgi:hypothetical protein